MAIFGHFDPFFGYFCDILQNDPIYGVFEPKNGLKTLYLSIKLCQYSLLVLNTPLLYYICY